MKQNLGSRSREGRRSPRRIDSQHGDEPQGDPAVETPLVDGGGEADDAHEQELVVFKVLLRHLEEEHIPDSLKSHSEEKLIRPQTQKRQKQDSKKAILNKVWFTI